jgi:hypothetical protein
MTRTVVESKMFSVVAYGPSGKCCTFRSDAAASILSLGFTPSDYDNFLAAESKRRFFLPEIRDLFRYERLARC